MGKRCCCWCERGGGCGCGRGVGIGSSMGGGGGAGGRDRSAVESLVRLVGGEGERDEAERKGGRCA